MTEEGYENFREELDFVKLHKRIRMHGIALYYLLKVRERRLVERLASFRPLKLKDNEPSKDRSGTSLRTRMCGTASSLISSTGSRTTTSTIRKRKARPRMQLHFLCPQHSLASSTHMKITRHILSWCPASTLSRPGSHRTKSYLREI